MEKSTADLTTENTNSVVSQTTPESITPSTLGALLQDIIDSMFNKTTDTPASYSGVSSGPSVALPAANVPIMLGLSATITPNRTGKVLINVSGQFNCWGTSAVTYFTVRVGTGSAPSNGAAASGTTIYSTIRSSESNTYYDIALSTIAIGLTKGTTYWIDLAVATNLASPVTAYFVGTSITAIEQ